MRKFMKDIDSFKNYMNGIFSPKYLKEYINSLDELQLEWFYNQMKEPMEFLVDEKYLFYKFKWIKDRDFTDLSKEIFIEYLCNPEGYTFPIIKEEWEDILYERYFSNLPWNH